MPLKKITYTDKETNGGLNAVGRFSSADANEIKDVVNSNAEELRTFIELDYVNYLLGITQEETVGILNHGKLNNYHPPSTEYVKKLDGFIRDLKVAELWNKFDLAYWMVGDGDMNFKTINIVNPSKFKGAVIGGLVNTLNGIEGNGVDGYIDTNFNHQRDSVKQTSANAGRSAYLYEWGSQDFISGDSANIWRAVSGYSAQRVNSTSGGANPALPFHGPGFKAISKLNSIDIMGVNEDVQSMASQASSGSSIHSVNHEVFSRTQTAFSSHGMSFYALGAAIVNEDATNLRQAILNNL